MLSKLLDSTNYDDSYELMYIDVSHILVTLLESEPNSLF